VGRRPQRCERQCVGAVLPQPARVSPQHRPRRSQKLLRRLTDSNYLVSMGLLSSQGHRQLGRAVHGWKDRLTALELWSSGGVVECSRFY
jgi:hypothetical protein